MPGMRPVRMRPRKSCAAWRTRNKVVVIPQSLASRVLAVDEAERPLARLRIGKLLRRRLHEVRGGAGQRAGDAAVERQLGAAHGVDDDPGGIRRIPNLKLQLQ